jgi:hypothetical protein
MHEPTCTDELIHDDVHVNPLTAPGDTPYCVPTVSHLRFGFLLPSPLPQPFLSMFPLAPLAWERGRG